MSRVYFYCLMVFSVSYMPLYPETGFYTPEHSSEIVNYYLGSYGGKTTIEREEKKKDDLPFFDRIANFFKYKDVPAFTHPLSDSQQRNLLINEIPLQIYNEPAVITTQLLYNERIFHGGERPQDTLFARIAPHIQTLAGERHMVEALSQPISDHMQLTKRQAIIKELVDQPNLLQQLSSTLSVIKDNELTFLHMYIDKTETENEAINQLLFGKWFGIGESLNSNPTALEIKRRLVHSLQFLGMSWPFATSAYFGYRTERVINDGSIVDGIAHGMKSSLFPIKFLYPFQTDYIAKGLKLKEKAENIIIAIQNNDIQRVRQLTNNLSPEDFALIGFKDTQELLTSMATSSPKAAARIALAVIPSCVGDLRSIIAYIRDYKDLNGKHDPEARMVARFLSGTLTTTVISLYSFISLGIWSTYRNAKFENDITLLLHQQLIQLSRYIRGCEKLYLTIKNNPVLSHNLEYIKHLEDLVTQSKKHSHEFNEFINILNSSTFTGNASFFSLVGKVFAAQTLITKVRSEFKGMIQALGEIDAAVAVAQLYNTFRDTNTPYCFPDYIESNTPRLSITDFWNPFLNPEHVVTNSLEFGNQSPRSMILTGPNTGGKSTCIEGVLLNALLAQTIGIAPSREFAFTPFAKITLYARIVDDIGAGDSRFQAEVKASKKQLEAATNLRPREFSLNARDEGIVGTDREVGENAEYIFSKKLGDAPNSINLISTHYQKMIDLETAAPAHFKNYHMQIGRSESGSLIRYFTLAEGPNTINIAMDILHEQGVL